MLVPVHVIQNQWVGLCEPTFLGRFKPFPYSKFVCLDCN
jgi:hypothetical protein